MLDRASKHRNQTDRIETWNLTFNILFPVEKEKWKQQCDEDISIAFYWILTWAIRIRCAWARIVSVVFRQVELQRFMAVQIEQRIHMQSKRPGFAGLSLVVVFAGKLQGNFVLRKTVNIPPLGWQIHGYGLYCRNFIGIPMEMQYNFQALKYRTFHIGKQNLRNYKKNKTIKSFLELKWVSKRFN